jgi:hypothetical protein
MKPLMGGKGKVATMLAMTANGAVTTSTELSWFLITGDTGG